MFVINARMNIKRELRMSNKKNNPIEFHRLVKNIRKKIQYNKIDLERFERDFTNAKYSDSQLVCKTMIINYKHFIVQLKRLLEDAREVPENDLF